VFGVLGDELGLAFDCCGWACFYKAPAVFSFGLSLFSFSTFTFHF
jgi:hypothetical protein